MEVIDSERYLFVSKDESINADNIAAGIELMAGDKCHIDSYRDELFAAVARQIHSHRATGCEGMGLNAEVHHWACVLHSFFFVENRRNKDRELGLKTIETELFNLIAQLNP